MSNASIQCLIYNLIQIYMQIYHIWCIIWILSNNICIYIIYDTIFDYIHVYSLFSLHVHGWVQAAKSELIVAQFSQIPSVHWMFVQNSFCGTIYVLSRGLVAWFLRRRIFLVAAPITIAMAAFFECPIRTASRWEREKAEHGQPAIPSGTYQEWRLMTSLVRLSRLIIRTIKRMKKTYLAHIMIIDLLHPPPRVESKKTSVERLLAAESHLPQVLGKVPNCWDGPFGALAAGRHVIHVSCATTSIKSHDGTMHLW